MAMVLAGFETCGCGRAGCGCGCGCGCGAGAGAGSSAVSTLPRSDPRGGPARGTHGTRTIITIHPGFRGLNLSKATQMC